MVREAVDEVRRYQRDKEMNSQLYSKLTVRGSAHRLIRLLGAGSDLFFIIVVIFSGKIQVKSSDIQVGDLIIVEKVTFPI